MESITFKLLVGDILHRLFSACERSTRENQTSFPPDPDCIDRIFTLRQILEPDFRAGVHGILLQSVSNRLLLWLNIAIDVILMSGVFLNLSNVINYSLMFFSFLSVGSFAKQLPKKCMLVLEYWSCYVMLRHSIVLLQQGASVRICKIRKSRSSVNAKGRLKH